MDLQQRRHFAIFKEKSVNINLPEAARVEDIVNLDNLVIDYITGL